MNMLEREVAVILARNLWKLTNKSGPELAKSIMSSMAYSSSEDPGMVMSVDVTRVGIDDTSLIEQDYTIVSKISEDLGKVGMAMAILDERRIGVCKP